MALQLSICHQSSENEGAASAGAHVISTICDSTHEVLVRTNMSCLVFLKTRARRSHYLYVVLLGSLLLN